MGLGLGLGVRVRVRASPNPNPNPNANAKQVRATPSGGLHCDGPHLLVGAAAAVRDGVRLRTHMRETGRVHPVSEALRLQGVEHFWCLAPEEPNPNPTPDPTPNPNPNPNQVPRARGAEP